MWRNLAKAVRELQRTYGEAFASYRPDLYYMRGPGPKWRAKHPGIVPTAASVAAGAPVPTLREIAELRA
jgi:hypothetical protein